MKFFLVKHHRTGSYLGYAGRTKPVSVWDLRDFRPQAIHVAATVTAVTKQQALVIVPLPANLASLEGEITGK